MTEKILVPNQADVLREFRRASVDAALADAVAARPDHESTYHTYKATKRDKELGVMQDRAEHLGLPGDLYTVSVYDNGKRLDAAIRQPGREVSTYRMGDEHMTVMNKRSDGEVRSLKSESRLVHDSVAAAAVKGAKQQVALRDQTERDIRDLYSLPESHGPNN